MTHLRRLGNMPVQVALLEFTPHAHSAKNPSENTPTLANSGFVH